jgi:hypothetical protein
MILISIWFENISTRSNWFREGKYNFSLFPASQVSPPPSTLPLTLSFFSPDSLGPKSLETDTTWKSVTEELIKEVLEIVLNVENHPVMVTCTYERRWRKGREGKGRECRRRDKGGVVIKELIGEVRNRGLPL